jgi:ABC-type transporter Mla subunit MlaD
MNNLRSSLTTVVMLATAVLGWLISLTGVIGIWNLYPRVIHSVHDGIGLANRSLDTSIQLLDGIDTTIQTANDTVLQIRTGLLDVSKTFGNTSPLFDSAANMVGKDFSKMVDDSRVALVSLSSTAKVIDDTLRFLSSFPLIGQSYNPPVPLDTSINNLASSIEKLPSNLSEIQSWLNGTGKDLSALKEDTSQLAKSIDKVTPQLSTALQVTARYRQLVRELKAELVGLETRLSQSILLLAICVSIFLGWIALAQVGPFLQAIERMRPTKNDEDRTPASTSALDNEILSSIEDSPTQK